MMYAVVSVNTTGSELRRNKIIELAILISDGNQIIDSYNTLLNPERKIPYNCTRKCGIDDAMVAQSRKFYEIAGIVLDMLKGKTIIGHHVKHSYRYQGSLLLK